MKSKNGISRFPRSPKVNALGALIFVLLFIQPVSALDADILTLNRNLLLGQLGQVEQSVVVVIPNDSSKGQGTGVYFVHNGHELVFTNAHVVAQSTECAIMILNSSNNPGFIWSILVASDAAKDVAILYASHTPAPGKVIPLLKRLDIKGPDTFFEQLSMSNESVLEINKHNLVVSDVSVAKKSEVRPGLEVYFLGFPLGIGASLGAKEPVVRHGIVATRMSNDDFYIDAMVNHGNSGSPVFVPIADVTSSSYSYRLKLIGIVSGFRPDYVEYGSGDGGKISLPHNSGLARVISIAAYLRIADSALKSTGNIILNDEL